MPEEFDPRWEYWTPDPEIAEAMGAVEFGVELFERKSFRGGSRGKVEGFRIGHPKGGRFKLGIPRGRPRETIEPRRCENRKCNRWFTPLRDERKYCSRQCIPGNARQLPESRDCEYCNVTFVPLWQRHTFCSADCANRAQKKQHAARPRRKPGRKVTLADKTCRCGATFHPRREHQKHCSIECRPGNRPKLIDDAELSRLYLAGVSFTDIARAFGVTRPACRDAAKRLGLPPRHAVTVYVVGRTGAEAIA